MKTRIVVAALALAATPGLAWGQSTTFRGGNQHPGTYAQPSASASGLVQWSVPTEGPVRSSPAVTETTVFFGSGDGHLYAVRRRSGAVAWRFAAEAPVYSSPTVWEDLVVFAAGDNDIFGVNAESGDLAWRAETGATHPWAWGHEGWDYFHSSPVVADGRVVVGSGDGFVYALDARTGKTVWRHRTGGRVRSSPAVADGIVFVGSADGVLYALDLSDGSPRWTFETHGAGWSSETFAFDRVTIQGSPAVWNGTVYFGARDGRTYAVEASSGALVWETPDAAPWFVTSPALQDGILYAGNSDGLYVHALDALTGEELWRTPTGQRVFSSPAVAGDALFVGNQGGRFMKLSAADGRVEWDLRLGEAVASSPVVVGDHVYFGADDGLLRAVQLRADPPPLRGVYWDSTRVAFNTLPQHEEIRDLFRRRGYRVLDRTELAAFMAEAASSDRVTVVVFALDDLPPEIVPGPEDGAVLDSYLASGGKVVWLGMPPFLLERDGTGAIVGNDRVHPTRLLRVDHDTYNVDLSGNSATAEGRRWGLSGWWVGVSGIADPGVDALARDDIGGAAAWVKRYRGPPGSGFVFLWGTYRPLPHRLMDLVVDVAEYGVGRTAS